MIFAIIAFTYLGISLLWVGRWIYRSDDDQRNTIRFKAAMVFVSPLMLVGWLQIQIRKKLDVWYDKGMTK